MRIRLEWFVLGIGIWGTATFAQTDPASSETVPANAPVVNPAAPAQDLAQTQLQLLRDFDRFEKSLYDVAEFSRRTDPDRAELLFRARSQSQEQRILTEMQTLADSLKPRPDGKLVIGDTPERQAEVLARLRVLLKVLQSADDRERHRRDIEAVMGLLKDTNHVIGRQRDVMADTLRGGDADQLTGREKEVADEAGELARKIDERDAERQGKNPSDSGPGQDKPESAPGKSPPPGSPSDDKSEDSKDAGDKPEGGAETGENGAPKNDEPSSKNGEPKPRNDKTPEDRTPNNTPPMDKSPMGDPSQEGGSPTQGNPPNSKSPPKSGGQPRELGQGNPPSSQPAPAPPRTEGDSPSQKTPGRESLEAARKEMQKAIEELQKKANGPASESQQQALAQLEQLKAHLEEILRQLREEEKELMLAGLESRLQKIRKAQMQVNAETSRLEKIPAAERGDRHLDRSVAAGRDQREIVIDAEHALELLKEEGSSVAFPEAIEQMRDNMITVSNRLNRGDTAETTQVIEELIVETLDEMILAMQQEMDRKKKKDSQGQPQQAQDPGLVQRIADLKMIRSLQNQINRLTRQLSRDVEGEQAIDPDHLKTTNDLARRQKRLQQATNDLATGKNE